ncbi:hypothetical protein BX616_003580 [Lobosporangium transversale]|uniref:Late embryogenesis abundant protein LEA-2 subgroup domain-containing protein n=1 Tax=Lobosporangium transversale TaxID=64571 RepID=A0A1Y2GDU5_9FUNG|nr:hypothetical protein BCR41DRAFT_359804 [Lobosporangium transversale]KAF9916506.1 hypothetical protein BX616_003580 [Lobosporangium transversale]ORZ08032.1 hypothetical protein BCR41DRAFT_359804 [Lobosporangium transversale]|eukprot:XP_021878266.1 hypothetical protein BCR41DRAFT_359804 [Lobosporangium transversale]
MSYYNNPTSPRQNQTAAYVPASSYSPSVPYSTKPSSGNTFITTTPTYISSPFDDDPVVPNNNNSYEKTTPYNPDYMPNTSQTNEHALSPSFTEKNLAAGAGAGVGQTYAMHHLNTQQNNSYDPYGNNLNNQSYASYNSNNRESYGYDNNNNYYNGYDEERPSLSNDTAPMRPYADMETSEGLTRHKSGVTRVKYGKKEKSKCLPCFPCIRSTCGRITCCFCIILLLLIIALVVVVFTLFKVPTVNYKGMQAEPQFLFNQGGTTLQVQFAADIEVTNPNPLGFKFESIVATAYYPKYEPSIGGGNLTNVEFPSKTTKTITFPISAAYSGSQDPGFTVVKDILTRCGKLGGDATDLTINYDLKLTVKLLFFNISPTIKDQHVNFACPADIDSIANGVPGGIGAIIGGKAT